MTKTLKDENKWIMMTESRESGNWSEFYEQKVEVTEDEDRFLISVYGYLNHTLRKMMYKIETGLYQFEEDEDEDEDVQGEVRHAKEQIEKHFADNCSSFVNLKTEKTVHLYFVQLKSMYETLDQLKAFLEEL